MNICNDEVNKDLDEKETKVSVVKKKQMYILGKKKHIVISVIKKKQIDVSIVKKKHRDIPVLKKYTAMTIGKRKQIEYSGWEN